MQFRHPELLYALFLLLIPIIVHLFQLRKFRKEQFTNVAFLKKLDLQTRKSNKIKKWLILLMRLGVIAMAVLAFAQPFLTSSTSATKEKETLIYLDNSFSMQAKGASGPLLKQAVQELIGSLPKETDFTLLTNTDTYKNTRIEDIRNTLLQLPYSANELSLTEVNLRAQKYLSKDPATIKRLILISDFQQHKEQSINTKNEEVHYVQLSPANTANIVIDSLFIENQTPSSLSLKATLSSQETMDIGIPVSVFNKDELMAKATASFKNATKATINFDIDKQTKIEGILRIEDPTLSYDNSLFFSINTAAPIKILSINDADSDFLKRLYNTNEFDYKAVTSDNIDFSEISQYNLVVVNGLKKLPLSLGNALASFKNKGGSVLVILNEEIDAAITNNFLNLLGTTRVSGITDQNRLVTNINYDHPIYTNVFDKKIDNFQYPSVNKSFNLSSQDALLSFQDGQPFITAENKLYITTNRFNIRSTNFKNSPLIVPTLYNIAKESLALPNLYYVLGTKNEFDVRTRLSQDEILSLKKIGDTEGSFIPVQRTYSNKVAINTLKLPALSGNYQVTNKDSILQVVSYNYNRAESSLRYSKINSPDNGTYHTSVANAIDEFKEQDTIQSLWKWFVIFALLFLLMEMLILKYFK